jgi:preprotein translocase subunit SecG
VYTFLLFLLLLIGLLLMVIVLMQAGKGGGLAAMGGGAVGGADNVFGSRQAAGLMVKATWWMGGAFLVLALILSSISRAPGAQDSILRSPGAGGAGPVTAPEDPRLPGTVPGTTQEEAAPVAPQPAETPDG